MKDFYRFVKMQDATHLHVEGVMEAQRPWWDETGEILCPESFREGMEMAGEGPLTVHINSPGGDLTAGIAMFEMLRQHKGKTRCEITYAGSAAGLLPCGCDESLISPAGLVMLHNPAVMVMGDEGDMERGKKALAAWKQAAIGAYQQRIKKSEEEIAAMMSEETFLPAQAAVEVGLCDGVLDKATGMQMYNRQAVMVAERESFDNLLRGRQDLEENKERQALIAWAKE